MFADRPPQPMDVHVKDGQIAALLAPGEALGRGVAEQSAKGLHVFPGLIHAQVHFGLSGEKVTEYATETRHAAQGGFTTVMGYLLNNEAYPEVFRREHEHAKPRAHVDYAFHFSAPTSCTSTSSKATCRTTASPRSSTS